MGYHHVVEGYLTINARGFGFVNFEAETGGRGTAFIPARELRGFLKNDRVRTGLEQTKDGRWTGSDLELVSRRRETLFGRVVFEDGATKLKVDPEVANRPWPLDSNGLAVGEGDLVLARIDDGVAFARRVIPPGEEAVVRLRARHNIRHEFPEECLRELDGLAPVDPPGRRDLRDLTTLTIDAPTSRDLDDALSVRPAGDDGAIRVYVHIADVDAWVQPDSELDKEARRRATSVYIAGGMTPMLPPELSEQRVSVLPDEERLALTAELRVDPAGDVRSVDIYRSRIRSDRRCSYVEVAAFLTEGDEGTLSPEIQDALRWIWTAASRIGRKRRARGGLRIDRFETYVQLDDAGQPIALKGRKNTVAHELIERLMVAANEAVAKWLLDRGLPGVFRVHPEPKTERVGKLEASARRLGVALAFGGRLTPKALSAVDEQLQNTSYAPAMQRLVRRLLGPAQYSPTSGPHFGLGSPGYLHFTSPIRRYADLVVHRIVKAYLAGERDLDSDALGLAETCLHLDDAGRRARKAEEERTRVLTAHVLAERKGERFDARVVGVKPFGAIVLLEGTGVTAALPTDSLGSSWRATEDALVSSTDRLDLGDRLAVTISRADPESGHVDVVPL